MTTTPEDDRPGASSPQSREIYVALPRPSRMRRIHTPAPAEPRAGNPEEPAPTRRSRRG